MFSLRKEKNYLELSSIPPLIWSSELLDKVFCPVVFEAVLENECLSVLLPFELKEKLSFVISLLFPSL